MAQLDVVSRAESIQYNRKLNTHQMKSIIYYTDNELAEPLFSVAQSLILDANLPIVSVSLKPINFGKNVVVSGQRGYPTMVKQILTALEMSRAEHVFFCEHDCLYPKSHFDFTPTKNNIFYYNENVWRWWFKGAIAITYDRMLPLSCMCVNREFALAHYRMRQRKIEESGADSFKSREPLLVRQWGYEPGTKKTKRGGLTDDDFETWRSKEPVIDIRHKKSFSPPKITLDSFKHAPTGWKEMSFNEIPGWNLKELFNL